MKKQMKIIFSILILFSCISGNSAQQNPPGIQWKSIDAGNYEIIFPAELTPLGQKVANMMNHYEKYIYNDMKTMPRKIPVVLINEYSEPNGFVSFAPFYSHWFTTPSSFASNEWFKGLAIHEGRHIAQLNKLKDGRGKAAWRVLFGDEGTAVFSGIYIPAWFFEGDAVALETSLTKGGRGRSPYFDLWYRGVELSGERYSYYKSYLGSYDALIPYSDRYRLGYLLCSYIQNHYGNDIWERVLSKTGRYFMFYTFSSSLKSETGRTITELYADALDEYRSIWEEQQTRLKITDAEIKALPGRKTWESYLYPFMSGDGDLTAVRFSGNRKISLVRFNKNNETGDIKQLSYDTASSFMLNERMLSSGGNSVLWREAIPDPRWGYKSFSDLCILDLNTGKTRFISDNKKFIASAISMNGKIAAGIEYGTDLKYYLTLIETDSKQEIFREEIKDKGYLFDPAISPDGKEIALAALSESGSALLLYNLETKTIRTVIEYTKEEQLRAPVFYDKYILYGSDYSGIDNIYAVDIKDKKRFQVTSRPLGAYYPSVNNSSLYFNDYSVNGYQPALMKLDPAEWIPLEKAEKRMSSYIEPVARDELSGDNGNIDIIPEHEYPVDDYSHFKNTINVFGWLPYLDVSSTNFYFILLSRNVLQTTDLQLSYLHNFNEKKDSVKAALSYYGLYPVFNITSGYGGRASYLKNESSADDPVFLTWDEVTGSAKAFIPLNFSRGVSSTRLSPGAEAGYIKIYDKSRDDYTVHDGMSKDGELKYIRYFLSFKHIVQGALNSLSPGSGQTLDISYTQTPLNGYYRGSLFSADIAVFLPGITDLQGLKISGSFERIKAYNYVFPQEFLFPRGYDPVRYKKFFKGGADYMFPIVNLSTNIWKLVYFKRINGDIFYDYGTGVTDYKFKNYRSAGFELTAEQNLLSNTYLDIEAGIRYSRCFDTNGNTYEFVIKSSL